MLIGGVGAGLMAVSLEPYDSRPHRVSGQHRAIAHYSKCLALLWWGWRDRGRGRVLLAGCMRGPASTYLYALTHHTFSLSAVRFELSAAHSPRRRQKSYVPSCHVCRPLRRCSCARGCADGHIFRPAPRPYMFLRAGQLWIFRSLSQRSGRAPWALLPQTMCGLYRIVHWLSRRS